MPPVGPPIVVPMGRAIQNEGIELDSRFQVSIKTKNCLVRYQQSDICNCGYFLHKELVATLAPSV